jgi:hypothetical protein
VSLVRQKRVQEQVPRPTGCADRLRGGFSLTEAMGITKDEMNLVRVSTEVFIFTRSPMLTNPCKESVRSSLHANLGGPFKNGTVKYDSIDLEVLGSIRNDVSVSYHSQHRYTLIFDIM